MHAALLLAALAAAPDGEPARPDVVFILADDLGFGDLSAMRAYGGADDIQTPHIDSLFADGLTFTHFRANCTVCSPTRAALMTGRFPASVGVPGVIRPWPEDNWGCVADDRVFFPELLRDAGYRTALVGKWHLGGDEHNGDWNNPADRGFDLHRGFRGGMLSDYVAHTRRFPDGSDRNVMTEPGTEGRHATDLFTDWAVEFLEAQGAARRLAATAKREPFFLELAYNAPHTPIQPPAEWVERVTAREAGIDPKRAELVALIEHMDAGVGRVLAALDDAGLAGDALVVFTSDNGGLLRAAADNGPHRGGKEDLYEGGLRVPCAVRWPGRVEPGATTDVPATTMDWAPTLASVGDAWTTDESGSDMHGVDLTDVLEGRGDGVAEMLRDRVLHVTRREGRPAVWAGKTGDAVIAGDWKLVQNRPFQARELFHLADDPGETTDLSGSNRPELLELSRLMQDRRRLDGAVPFQAPTVAE